MQVVGLMSNGGYNEETDSGDVYLWLGGSMLSTGRDRKVLESCRPNCMQVQHQNVVFPKGCAPALHSTLRSIDAVALRSDDSWSVAVLCQEHG